MPPRTHPRIFHPSLGIMKRTSTLLLCLLAGVWLAAGPAQAQEEKNLSFSESLDDDGMLIVDARFRQRVTVDGTY